MLEKRGYLFLARRATVEVGFYVMAARGKATSSVGLKPAGR